MKARTTAEIADDLAERELISRDKVAYERQVAIDPDFASVDGQVLPDRFYAHAARMVRLRKWTQRKATAYLQGKIHARRMVAIGKDNAARSYALSRIDAALHNLFKTGGASLICLCVLYLTTGPENTAMVAPFAVFFTALRIVGGAIARDVL